MFFSPCSREVGESSERQGSEGERDGHVHEWGKFGGIILHKFKRVFTPYSLEYLRHSTTSVARTFQYNTCKNRIPDEADNPNTSMHWC